MCCQTTSSAAMPRNAWIFSTVAGASGAVAFGLGRWAPVIKVIYVQLARAY